MGTPTGTGRPSLASKLLVRYLRLDKAELLQSLRDEGISVLPDARPIFVDA